MPRALAIESSGRIGSIALSEDGVVLEADQFPHGLKHAAEIIPRIDALCRRRGWTPADLAEVYVSVGPGSFTGLRIGVTLAKTLALATGAKVVAVPSAEVLARNAPAEAADVITVLDAKRGQIFTARFHRTTAGWEIAEPPRLDTLGEMLSRAPRPVWLIGEGIPYHETSIPADDAEVIRLPDEFSPARAEVVVEVGHALARRGEFADADALTPVYLRKPEAEEKWEERAAGKSGDSSGKG